MTMLMNLWSDVEYRKHDITTASNRKKGSK